MKLQQQQSIPGVHTSDFPDGTRLWFFKRSLLCIKKWILLWRKTRHFLSALFLPPSSSIITTISDDDAIQSLFAQKIFPKKFRWWLLAMPQIVRRIRMYSKYLGHLIRIIESFEQLLDCVTHHQSEFVMNSQLRILAGVLWFCYPKNILLGYIRIAEAQTKEFLYQKSATLILLYTFDYHHVT